MSPEAAKAAKPAQATPTRRTAGRKTKRSANSLNARFQRRPQKSPRESAATGQCMIGSAATPALRQTTERR